MSAIQTPFTESRHPYWPRRDGNVEIILPNSANAVLLGGTGFGLSYAWSTYAGTPFATSAAALGPLVIVGLYIQNTSAIAAGTATTIHDHQWQIAIGEAGAEVPIAHGQEIRSIANPAPNSVNVVVANAQLWTCDPILVPGSTRINIRNTQSTPTSQQICSAYLVAYDATKWSPPAGNIDLLRFLKGVRLTTASLTPSAAGGVAVTSAASWVFGGWTQIIASASRDALITHIGCDPGSNNSSMQGEIGIGAAGSEVSVAAFAQPRRTASGGATGVVKLYRPVFVKAGESVSIRMKTGVATQTFDFWLQTGDLL